MKRTLFLISIILILFLSFTSISAGDLDSNSTLTDINDNSFEAIQEKVNNAGESQTVSLEGSYVGSGNAITIDKRINIKGTGSGASLTAQGKSQILIIKADNVVIENIAFTRGYNSNEGGAIYATGNNLVIKNCNFTSNEVEFYGGAILSEGDNVKITNCRFSNNLAKYTGGAFQLNGNSNYVSDCEFINNKGGHVGASVAWVGDNGVLTNSKFTGTTNPIGIPIYGGAIAWMGANGSVSKSTFIKNSAKKSGAAIYWRGINGALNYNIFINNTSGNDSAYSGNPDYACSNYWGENIANSDEFVLKQLIYYNGEFKAPSNWVNINTEKYLISFKQNTGELKGVLPDFKYGDVVISNNVYIIKKATSLTCKNLVTYCLYNGKYLKIVLKDENKQKLASKTLQIKINGKTYNKKTDKNGVVKLHVKLKKSAKAKITFKGDKYYKASSKTVNIVAKKQKTALTIKKSGKNVKFVLKNQFKKAISKAIIKVKINKKTYKVKTNSKGVALLKVPLKKYKVEAKFSGNKYYKSSYKSVK